MAEDGGKTMERLVEEVEALRRRVGELEHAERELQGIRKALQQGVEAFNVVLENSRDILAILREDGTVAYVSPSAERITGHHLEELSGLYAFDLVHPDDADRVLKSFAYGLEEPGRTINEEFRYRHADGSWHSMEAQAINLTDNPTVSGMVLSARDISDRKSIEERLQRRERYYHSLIRNAVDMIVVLDRDSRFVWGSAGAARVTGYRPEDIYGRSIFDFIHPDDVDASRQLSSYLLQNPGATSSIESRFLHKDGSYHYHEAIITNLLEDPSVQGMVMNSRDISERKLMEDEILATNRELDSFASTVAHDLRTPLSLIEGYAQLMRAEGHTEEEREAYLKSIIAAARRMDELTESLLEYAQAGQPGGSATLVEPLDVISDVIFEHSSEIEGKGIEVILGEDFPAIKVDHYKLRQVFTNLINNAVKYLAGTPEPRIEIASRTDAGKATFYVSDNGPGLDPEMKEEAFLPFKRSSIHKSPGLGIGLSTVKRAVEGWGGRIWVESEPGKGATFFFTAPLGS
jgi:PAS domain S-box-containing protein